MNNIGNRFLDESRIKKCNLNFDVFNDNDLDYNNSENISKLKERLNKHLFNLEIKDNDGIVYNLSLRDINSDNAELNVEFQYISKNSSCSFDTQGKDDILIWDFKNEKLEEFLLENGYEVLN